MDKNAIEIQRNIWNIQNVLDGVGIFIVITNVAMLIENINHYVNTKKDIENFKN